MIVCLNCMVEISKKNFYAKRHFNHTYAFIEAMTKEEIKKWNKNHRKKLKFVKSAKKK